MILAVVLLLAGVVLLLPRRPHRSSRVRLLLDSAGHAGMSTGTFIAGSAASAVGAGVVGLLLTATAITAVLGLCVGAYVPTMLLRRQRTKRIAAARSAWPDVVDDLSSAVRAGLPLPDAIREAGSRAPLILRDPFRRFSDDLRVNGRFHEALDAMKASLADPVADRVIEALRLAREVGGSDLGRLLRDLSESLRAHSRLRAEVEARQSWTINSARLAVAAPWITLVFLATRREAVEAFNTAIGALVIAGAALISVVAYRLMLVLGRLPQEERVLA